MPDDLLPFVYTTIVFSRVYILTVFILAVFFFLPSFHARPLSDGAPFPTAAFFNNGIFPTAVLTDGRKLPIYGGNFLLRNFPTAEFSDGGLYRR